MLPPSIQIIPQVAYDEYLPTLDLANPSFTNYVPGGVIPATYTNLPTNGGTGTEIVDVNMSDVTVSLGPLSYSYRSPATVRTDTSIYALRINTPLLNPDSGPLTLHIHSGGLLITAFSGSYSGINIDPNLDFGSAPAIVNNATSLGTAVNAVMFNGVVTALNGITKLGSDFLYLTNPDSQIAGPITVYQSTLGLASISATPTNDPLTLYGSTTFVAINSLSLLRPIHVVNGPCDPSITNAQSPAVIAVVPGNTLTLAGPITSEVGLAFGQWSYGSFPDGGNVVIHLTGTATLNAPAENFGFGLSPGMTLRVDGTITTNRTANIYGILSGTGTVNAAEGLQFNVSSIGTYGSVLSPGNGVGDLGTLSLISPVPSDFFGDMQFDIDANGQSDHLIFSAPLTLDSTSTLDLNLLSPSADGDYILISAPSITGTFASVTGLPDNYHLDYSHPGLLLLTVQTDTTPEPATLALLTFASGALLIRRRAPCL